MIVCQFENGTKANLRHVTAAAIVSNSKNEVLIVRRAKGQLNEDKYTLPGGFLDRDENTKEGAIRELREETGLDGKVLYLFHIVDTPFRPKEDRQNVEFRYVAKIIGGKEKLSDETSEIKWISKDNLPSDNEFAFDHRVTLIKYFEYLNKPFELPFFN